MEERGRADASNRRAFVSSLTAALGKLFSPRPAALHEMRARPLEPMEPEAWAKP
jgi:hypothetical protein